MGAAITANRIARWDGSTWSALGSGGGNGVSGWVYALAVSGTDLYVGGQFTRANFGSSPITANRIGRWNGSAWSALGSGMETHVRALAATDLDTLYVAGNFLLAGGKPSSYIGRYTTRGSLEISLAGSGSGSVVSNPAGLDCPGICSAKFAWDQPIELTAAADPGSTFVGWSGGGCSGTGLCVIEFDQDMAVTAQFEWTYTIGGMVFDLAGSGLVLQNNGEDDLQISADGAFVFDTALPDGSAYDVTVAVQPTKLSQTCTVSNSDGVLAGADVTNVDVTCITNTYTIGGNVLGLAEGNSVVLANNDTDELTVSANEAFTFPQALTDGSAYEVTVLTQPNDPNQTCTVSQGQGNLAGADIDSVEVNCVTDTYLVTPEAGLGGSLDPESPQLVEHGQPVDFDVLADSGYAIGPVTGCDGELVDITYTTGPITAACTVTAEFIPQTVTSIVPPVGPIRLDEAEAFSITVTAPAAATEDGMVTLSADTGESCTDDSIPDADGSVATFACQITLENPGSRTLTATYSDSTTHGDSSSDPVTVQVMRFADLSIQAEADQTSVDGGDVIGWLVEVRNLGLDDAANTAIEINLSALPDDLAWTCAAIGTAICPAASGSGLITVSVDLPAGSGLDFVLSGEVPITQSANYQLSATVSPDATDPRYVHDPDQANNQSEVSVTVMRIFHDRFD